MGYTHGIFLPALCKKTLAHTVNNVEIPMETFAGFLLVASAEPEPLVQKWAGQVRQKVANLLINTPQRTKMEEEARLHMLLDNTRCKEAG